MHRGMNKAKVLVVDDEPNLSSLVRMFLERTKRFEVRVENRSACAVAVAETMRPDIILLDVDMPGKDGGQVARDLKNTETLKNIPILFLTSLISRDEAGNSPAVRGGMRFLAKPVSPGALVATVDSILAEASITA